jgi:hypothetical protein
MFEKEEAERHGCEVVERNEDAGGFMRWEGILPDVRTHAGPPKDDDYHTPAPGEKELPRLLRDDLSLFPRALRALPFNLDDGCYPQTETSRSRD